MKIPFTLAPSLRFLLGLGLAFAGTLSTARADDDAPLNPEQVDQLLGPIALYPDALVALILPASTSPADIVLAQRYLSSGGDPDQIDNQPWNESVKALARYPQLIQWMDENLNWTQQLGNVFLSQQDEVMGSVQRLRARARANGTLTSTPQQKLELDGDVIEIVPAQPDVIYVPYYDPNLVFNQPGYGEPPYVTFGIGLPVGFWLDYDFNWRSRVIIVGDRHHNWSEHRDWNRHPVSGGKPNYGNNWHPWKPPVTRPPVSRPDSRRPNPGVIQPRSFPSAPSNPPHDQHPERPRTDNPRDNNPRDNDHNRPPTPTNNPAWNQDNHDRHPPSTPTPAPRPEANPPQGNPPRPTGPTGTSNAPPPTPRPDLSNGPPLPRNVLSPGQPQPMPTRQPPSRPVEPRPAAPAPPPPSRDKDNPRDQQPEPPR
jgi:uncharacterized protein DUF3300